MIFLVVLIIVTPDDSSNTKVEQSNYTQIERLGDGIFSTIYDSAAKEYLQNNMMYYQVNAIDEGNQTVVIPVQKLLFQNNYYYNPNGSLNHTGIYSDPSKVELYHKIGLYNSSKKIVFVYPIFTQIAYEKNGFYDYYAGRCDSSCLTLKLTQDINGKYTSSGRAAAILTLLNYPYITDIDIDKNPDILKRYDTVIMLHNEYVTKREFDAVIQHPNVIYLYANALYAQVFVDYDSNRMTLIRGHGFPQASIGNGFDWKFDNSKSEYNNVCYDLNFTEVDNGDMLNCYPSYRLYYDIALLESLKND
ncbi:MAG: hypothetical protein P4K92_00650 [Candidatus Nitrosotalea sp.]|nr:hypothetical protein [Candidatus Nitrosotalea sp.]